MVKAVIFDMDGVIVDSEPIHFESDRMTMKHYGKYITDEELSRYVGVSNPDMWAELREKYQLEATVEELLETQFSYKKLLIGDRKLEPIDGIRELLEQLKGGEVRIGLASSSSREFIEFMLSNLGLAGYFEVVISGEEVQRGKPFPDIFLKAAQGLGVEPSDCMVIEDSGHGVKAAKRAGMRCVGFVSPNSGKQDLSSADEVVCSIRQINHWGISKCDRIEAE
ncbi:MAG: HAD family phosphatase [Clostridiaceae bacterium]|jgi:beta-phosphoglucomutase family hydrolase|nr:HAD family phosphatase [Clostridiaceae bacterium]